MKDNNQVFKVLIVDDSIVCRESIRAILSSDPQLEVIACLSSAEKAISFLKSNPHPDIISMDIHLPGMSGYEATQAITNEYPLPIVIVTGDNNELAKVNSFKALDAGALSILGKPPAPSDISYKRRSLEIRRTFRSLAKVKLITKHSRRKSVQSISSEFCVTDQPRVVAIGASTGGPPVLKTILGSIVANFPLPIVIVQHIANGFETCLVQHLNNTSSIRIRVAKDGERLEPGFAYVAPSDSFMAIDGQYKVRLSDRKTIIELNKTVDHLFDSIYHSYNKDSISILLTGMGKDGALGLKKLKNCGGITVIQDKDSSVIYGMPGAAAAIDAANISLDPENIASFLNKTVSLLGGKTK